MWGKKHEDTPFTSSGMATLTVVYSCGHSSVSSFVGDEDETTECSSDCTDCWKDSHSLLQEGQSLADFVAESTANVSPRKRGWW